jgi:hypothetical protein
MERSPFCNIKDKRLSGASELPYAGRLCRTGLVDVSSVWLSLGEVSKRIIMLIESIQTCRKVVLGIVVTALLCPLSTSAQMPRVLRCSGSLKAYCLHGGELAEIASSPGVFTKNQAECTSFQIGENLAKPYLQFNPWMGIQSTKFPQNLIKDMDLSFHKVDEENFEVVQEIKKDKAKKILKCSVLIDVSRGSGSAGGSK